MNSCTHTNIEPFNIKLDQFICSACKKPVNSNHQELNLCYRMGKLSTFEIILGITTPFGIIGMIAYVLWLATK